MTAAVLKMPVRARLECSACGANGEGSCECGVPYISAGVRTAEAVVKPENANKSHVVLAEELGVSDQTVRRARQKAASTNVEPEKRTGLDGKSYPATKARKPKARQRIINGTNELHEILARSVDEFTSRVRKFVAANPDMEPEAKQTLKMAMWQCADHLNQLADELDQEGN